MDSTVLKLMERLRAQSPSSISNLGLMLLPFVSILQCLHHSYSFIFSWTCIYVCVCKCVFQQHGRQTTNASCSAWGWRQCIYRITQQLLSPVFSRFLCPWEFGSGNVSLATKCITVVFPWGSFNAPSVTLPCRKRPW